MKEIILAIPLLPLLGFLINSFFGRFLKKKYVSLVGVGSVGISLVFSLYLIINYLLNIHPKPLNFDYFFFTPFPELKISFGLLIDSLSVFMLFFVNFVGFWIHLYSIGYMGKDEGYARYFSYLNLFMFFMLLLSLSNNFVLMFFGWEGVGLCSYLLIGFYFKEEWPSNAGRKAFIVNRVGDFGFLLGLFLLFSETKTFDFQSLFSGGEISLKYATPIALLLFMGATGKSAQIPLYVWLPDAMAGPTPVSALIHAATMVTAGVYMVARAHPIFLASPDASNVIIIIGGLTAFFAATMALTQRDIKKILAYSTISQLGYMFMAQGALKYHYALFHVFTHSFFKACLFLGSGVLIHSLHTNDIFQMGGLKDKMKTTHWTFLFATLAISGIPIFSGFFSKDAILSSLFIKAQESSWVYFFFGLGLVTAFLTAFYMFRLYYIAFHGEFRGEKEPHHEEKVMTFPLVILAIGSLVSGLIGMPMEKVNLLNNYFHPFYKELTETHLSHTLEILLILISIGVALLGWRIAYIFYKRDSDFSLANKFQEKFSNLYRILFNKYYVDEFYNLSIVKPFISLGKFSYKFLDEVLIDGFLLFISYVLQMVGEILRFFQTGNAKTYAIHIILGVVVLIWLIL